MKNLTDSPIKKKKKEQKRNKRKKKASLNYFWLEKLRFWHICQFQLRQWKSISAAEPRHFWPRPLMMQEIQ